MARTNSKINAPASPSPYRVPPSTVVVVSRAPHDNGLAILGHAIRDRGEMLSLTDIWKAAGADDSRKPYAWLRGEDANRFIEHLGDSIGNPEARISRFGLVDVAKGGAMKGQTFAHWQVALAYAKYLSPAFHAACNVIIRQHMEDRPPVAALPTELIEEFRCVVGISKSLMREVTVLKRDVARLEDRHVTALVSADPRHRAVASKTSLEILVDQGVPPHGRRILSQRVSGRLKTYCKQRKIMIEEMAYPRRNLFPVEAIQGWLRDEGANMIRDHIDDLEGRRRLPFPESKVVRLRR